MNKIIAYTFIAAFIALPFQKTDAQLISAEEWFGEIGNALVPGIIENPQILDLVKDIRPEGAKMIGGMMLKEFDERVLGNAIPVYRDPATGEWIRNPDFQQPVQPQGQPWPTPQPIQGQPFQGQVVQGTPVQGTPVQGTPLQGQTVIIGTPIGGPQIQPHGPNVVHPQPNKPWPVPQQVPAQPWNPQPTFGGVQPQPLPVQPTPTHLPPPPVVKPASPIIQGPVIQGPVIKG
jgi:hypothetical protein